jgi:hypothetical protein
MEEGREKLRETRRKKLDTRKTYRTVNEENSFTSNFLNRCYSSIKQSSFLKTFINIKCV